MVPRTLRPNNGKVLVIDSSACRALIGRGVRRYGPVGCNGHRASGLSVTYQSTSPPGRRPGSAQAGDVHALVSRLRGARQRLGLQTSPRYPCLRIHQQLRLGQLRLAVGALRDAASAAQRLRLFTWMLRPRLGHGWAPTYVRARWSAAWRGRRGEEGIAGGQSDRSVFGSRLMKR